MPTDLPIQSFNAGVFSEFLDGRSDLEKYYSAARIYENMIPLPYGPAERRPGTYFVGEVKDSSVKTRLIPFQYSTLQAYQIEFGDQYLRFYKDRGQIKYTDISFGADPSGDFAVGATMTGATSGATAIVVAKVSTQVYTIKFEQGTWTDGEVINSGGNNVDCAAGYPTTAASDTAVEIASSYLEADLPGLQRIQSADVLFNTHSSYDPKKLLRYSHDHWSQDTIVFDWPPFLSENLTNISITPPGTGTNVAPGETFSSSNAGASNSHDEAFDGDYITDKNGWETEPSNPTDQWIRVQFAADKTITKIRIQPCVDIGRSNRNVRRCKLQGSANGTDWTDISANKWTGRCAAYNTDEIEIEEIDNYDDWAEIEFTNAVAYEYYRLYCHDNWGGDRVGLKEMEMFESTGNTYTASAPIFTSNQVGSYWLIKHPRTVDDSYEPNKVGSTEADGRFNAAGELTAILKDVKGPWRFRTSGTWAGEVSVERSYDEGSTWHTLETIKSSNDLNFNVPGNEEIGDAWLRARAVDPPGTLSWEGTCVPTLTVERYYHYGIIRITELNSPTSVEGTVVRTVGTSAATKLWSEGAWSDERGFPATSEIFEGRHFFAGTTDRPLNIWGSKVNNYENMRAGSLDDDPVKYTVDSGMQNKIRWLVGEDVLLIGTSGAEWKLGSSDPASPITPTNPMRPQKQTTYGSAEIQAILLANAVLFADAQGRKVRGAQYIFEKGEAGGYDAPDYSMYAEHITASGIVDMDYQQNPYPILWCVRTDGKLIGMVFEPGQKVWGWFECVIDGLVESVSVNYGVTEDEVWIIVKRTINGETKRYIEYFKTRDWGSDQADCFFVDSGLTFDGGDAVAITNITKADPAVVTVSVWPTDGDGNDIADGDQIRIVNVVGMTEVNNKVFTVASANSSAKTFELRDKLDAVDYSTLGSDFTAYVSGGTVQKVDNAFLGLSHLEGKTVSVLGDGSVHADVTVSSGAVTLTDYYNKVHIGLPFTSKLQPMKLAIPGTGIRGKKKRISSILFSFYKTLGAKFGTTSGSGTIPFRKQTDAMGSPPPLFTGEKQLQFEGGYELEGNIYVEQTQPLPMTVRSITPKLGIYDG